MFVTFRSYLQKNEIKILKLTLATFIVVSLTAQKYFRFFTQWVDGASYVGMISSARASMSLDPTLFRSIIEINKTEFVYSVQQWCSIGLSIPSASATRVMQWHAYLIAYPLGAISRVTALPPSLVAALAESLALIGTVLFVMSHMKKKKLGFSLRLLWLLAAACSPVLVFGTLGNLQPERLLVFPMAVIVISLENICKYERVSLLALGSAYATALIISERSAFTAGWVTIAYLVLRNPGILRTVAGRFSAVCGASCFGWWYLWTKFVQSSPYYENISFKSISRAVLDSLTVDGAATAKMFFTVVPLLLLAIFRWDRKVKEGENG